MDDLSSHHEEPIRVSPSPSGAPEGEAPGADPVEVEDAPSSVLQIVPGPYKAPMSIRAAARFAQGGGFAHLGPGSLHGFGKPRGRRIVVVALVGLALVAAGGVGTALAFRFGGGGQHHHHHDDAPGDLQPASDGTQP